MIDLIYLYPQYNFLGKEINICRIIDIQIKETIVMYGISLENNIDIYITNTYTGENKLLKKINSIDDIDLLINRLQEEEFNIKNQEHLFSIEKYILKNI